MNNLLASGLKSKGKTTLIKIICLLILIIILLQSCAGHKELNKDSWHKFHADLYQDENNKLHLELRSFAEMTGGGDINFNYQNYGYYQTFSPIINQAQGIVLQVEANAHGKQLLRIKDKLHLIFYFGKKKEEFLLVRKGNRIDINALNDNHIIQFEKNRLNLLPDKLLQIKIPVEESLSSGLIKKLNGMGNPILRLPLGDYSHFFLGGYSNENAHLSSNSRYQFENQKGSDKTYFFKMNKNYAKTKELVQKFKSDNYKSFKQQIKYSFNFNIKELIESEKNGGFLSIKMPLKQRFAESRKSDSEIRFTLEKPGSVSLKIFDVLGNEIKEIKINIDTSGTFSYVWDRQVNEGGKVKPGVYFYHLYLDGKRTSTKRFIILK